MGRSRSRSRQKRHFRPRPKANPRGIMVARPGGFGFVRTSEGEFFVSRWHMNGAFDGDLVELKRVKSGDSGKKGADENADKGSRRPSGHVVRVIERAYDTLIGRYEAADQFGVVIPDNPNIPYDIFTLREQSPDVEDGSLVRVRITQFPTRQSAATGVVEEVLGHIDDAETGIDLIVARHKLETQFSEGALAEADAATLDVTGALAEGYRDIRDRFLFTIDPADARDFDDAISLEPAEDARWRLGVHIADVSHYVPWNSSIDLDARRRATSTYLVDRVIPMLPEALSNELCSLKPGEDRRSMTVDIFLDDEANVLSYDIYPALIRSKERLSYDEALAIIEGESADNVSDDLAFRIKEAAHISELLAKKRIERGGIDFSTTEARVMLNDEGEPVDVVLRTKNAATELIEQAMVLANETVASHLAERKWPCIYRVHAQPSPDSLEALVPVLQEFPWFTQEMSARLVTGDPHAIQDILRASVGRPEHELVTMLLLRSMMRAVYSPHCEPHYGLASNAYCHFTSPIRRYPDLVVHRMLRAQLTRRPELFDQEVSALGWISEHSSEMERIADTAAHESQQLKMVAYMRQFIGEAFSGLISGVSNYGLFVRLDNTAEGFLHVRALGPEYFTFDPVRYTLTSEETGKAYRLGHRIAVVLKDADPRTRKIDFTLA